MSDHTINFPTPTVHGQEYPDFVADPNAPSLENGKVYVWNSFKQAWEVKCEGGSGGGGVSGDFLGKFGDVVDTQDDVIYQFNSSLEFSAEESLKLSGASVDINAREGFGVFGTDNTEDVDDILYISRNTTSTFAGSPSHTINFYRPLQTDSGIAIVDEHLRGSAGDYLFRVKANRDIVDNSISNATGGLRTCFGVLGNGVIVLGSDENDPFIPTRDHHAVSKYYADNGFVKKEGDTINGTFNFDGQSTPITFSPKENQRQIINIRNNTGQTGVDIRMLASTDSNKLRIMGGSSAGVDFLTVGGNNGVFTFRTPVRIDAENRTPAPYLEVTGSGGVLQISNGSKLKTPAIDALNSTLDLRVNNKNVVDVSEDKVTIDGTLVVEGDDIQLTSGKRIGAGGGDKHLTFYESTVFYTGRIEEGKDLVNKEYVDSVVAEAVDNIDIGDTGNEFVNTKGDTMTGNLELPQLEVVGDNSVDAAIFINENKLSATVGQEQGELGPIQQPDTETDFPGGDASGVTFRHQSNSGKTLNQSGNKHLFAFDGYLYKVEASSVDSSRDKSWRTNKILTDVPNDSDLVLLDKNKFPAFPGGSGKHCIAVDPEEDKLYIMAVSGSSNSGFSYEWTLLSGTYSTIHQTGWKKVKSWDDQGPDKSFARSISWNPVFKKFMIFYDGIYDGGTVGVYIIDPETGDRIQKPKNWNPGGFNNKMFTLDKTTYLALREDVVISDDLFDTETTVKVKDIIKNKLGITNSVYTHAIYQSRHHFLHTKFEHTSCDANFNESSFTYHGKVPEGTATSLSNRAFMAVAGDYLLHVPSDTKIPFSFWDGTQWMPCGGTSGQSGAQFHDVHVYTCSDGDVTHVVVPSAGYNSASASTSFPENALPPVLEDKFDPPQLGESGINRLLFNGDKVALLKDIGGFGDSIDINQDSIEALKNYIDETFVKKEGGDEMQGPFVVTTNPDIADSRAARRIETLGVFSGTENSALRLGTNQDRVYIGNEDISFNKPIKVDTIVPKTDGNPVSFPSYVNFDGQTAFQINTQNGDTKNINFFTRNQSDPAEFQQIILKLHGATYKNFFAIHAGSGTNVEALRIDSGGAITIESNITVKSNITVNNDIKMTNGGQINSGDVEIITFGGTGAFYRGTISTDDHLVNKKYVDDAIAGTSAWTACTKEAGVAGTFRVRTAPGSVQLDMRLNKGGATFNSNERLGNIPTEFLPDIRPGILRNILVFQGGIKTSGSTTHAQIEVKPGGDVYVINNTQTQDIYLNATWWK